MSDADRFEVFVRRYQDMVFATAVRMLGRQADAEDIAQTVFLRAFERFAHLEANPGAPGWLKTVTRNLCLNHVTRHRPRWHLFSELDDAEGGMPFETTLVARQVDREDDGSRQLVLDEALRRLPDHQRIPLVLYHFEDQSYQAIATALGVSLGKVKTDIHRGREALKVYVTAYGSD
jgi:RNA polymerase sigma-70 factor (ECF subfamily)